MQICNPDFGKCKTEHKNTPVLQDIFLLYRVNGLDTTSFDENGVHITLQVQIHVFVNMAYLKFRKLKLYSVMYTLRGFHAVQCG